MWYVTCHGMLFGHNKEWGPDLQTVWLHHINLVQKAASSHSPAVLESDLSKQLSLSCSAFSREAWTTHPCRIGSVCGKGGSRKFSNSIHLKLKSQGRERVLRQLLIYTTYSEACRLFLGITSYSLQMITKI